MPRDLALVRNELRGLAERHRPRQFAEVVGQDEAVRYLAEQARARKGRGVLLHGPTGCGKTTLAEIYANALFCRKGDGDPCLQPSCPDCRDFALGIHPNWRWFRDGVTDERQFVHEINRAADSEAAGGGWLVVLIDQAERLSDAAFGALHSRLERPPEKVTFILCTADVAAIPRNVQRLFQPLEIRPAPMPARLELLRRVCKKECAGYEEGALERIAAQTGGSLGEALRDLEAVIRDGSATDERARAYYGLDRVRPAERYLATLLGDGGLDEQLDALLDNWELEAERKIRVLEALLASLWRGNVLRQAGTDTADDGLDWPERERIVGDLTWRGEQQGMRPRAFWQAVVKIWAPQTAATDASLLVKASEFDELVNGARGRQGAAVVRRRLEKVLQASRARSTSQTGAGEPGKSAGVSSGASGGGTDPDRYLSKKQVQALWDAGSFLIQQHGRLLNTRLSLRYAALGITDPRAVGPFLSRLTHEMRMLVKERTKRTRPEAFHWLYVHEHNDRQGMSTLLVAHLPEGAGDVTGWLRDDFLPRRVKVSFPEEAFTLRRARVPEERRFAHHLHLLLVLCRGIHPKLEVCFDDAEARMHRSYRRLRGPIGNRRGPQRYGVSELIGRGARDLVSELDLPVLSAFGEKQWGHLASGWEWEEHRYRQAIADERRALEDKVRCDWPGDEAKLEAFRRRWARGVATRAQCRPGFSKPGAPESADGGG